jgi:hypothetical protein
VSRLIRQLISVAAVALLAAIAVYGSYLPLRKSRLFHEAVQNLAAIHSPPQFAARLSVPLDAASPIGQGELVQETASLVLSLIQIPGTPSRVTAELAKFVNGTFEPIFQRGKGIGFAPTLYNVGAINVIAYFQTRDPAFLATAEKLFSRGREASPNRPEFLYGLFDVYRMTQNIEGAKAIADTILRQWPDDERTRAALSEYLAWPEWPPPNR